MNLILFSSQIKKDVEPSFHCHTMVVLYITLELEIILTHKWKSFCLTVFLKIAVYFDLKNNIKNMRSTNQRPAQTLKKCRWPAITAIPKKQQSLKWQGPASLGDLLVKAVRKTKERKSNLSETLASFKISYSFLLMS